MPLNSNLFTVNYLNNQDYNNNNSYNFLSSCQIRDCARDLTCFISCNACNTTIRQILLCNPIKNFFKKILFNCGKNTQPKIYHLNHSDMYTLVMLSIFALLCNRSPEVFHLAKVQLYAHSLNNKSSFPSSSSPW